MMESATLIKRAGCGIGLFLLLASPAFCGPLNGDATALLSGTTAFDNSVFDIPSGKFVGLKGTVDYAVYTNTAFQTEWGGLGYNPTGAVVYVYQVFPDPNSATLTSFNVSHLSVHIENPAGEVGSFTIGGGQLPSSAGIGALGPPSADWAFNPEIVPGASSAGLAFSSPYTPIMRYGSLVDGGTQADVIPLPTPGTSGIPEPGTIVLLVIGALFCLPTCMRRIRLR